MFKYYVIVVISIFVETVEGTVFIGSNTVMFNHFCLTDHFSKQLSLSGPPNIKERITSIRYTIPIIFLTIIQCAYKICYTTVQIN